MLCLLVFSSAWARVTFVSNIVSSDSGSPGGAVGNVIGNLALGALDKVPAALLFFVVAILAAFFAFGISLKVFLRIFNLYKRHEAEESDDLAELKANAKNSEFKLRAGVPVEGIDDVEADIASKPRFSSLRDTAQKLTKPEDHSALTTISDDDWQFPSIELLNDKREKAHPGDIKAKAKIIKNTLANFNIDVLVDGANVGSRVTQYTVRPSNGVKLSKITALSTNLALDLKAENIRIEAPIPGQNAVGIEVPNEKSAKVRISSIFQSEEWRKATDSLSVGLGQDISGKAVVESLDEMPHLLVAGQTNSGKSVMINSILTSLLYRNSPSDLKMILVDPKRVELSPYNDIPHLLTPVILEPEKCISALKWTVAEMERRYRALANAKRRNIMEYNRLNKEEPMPYIVIVIDELADLMMAAARDVEALIIRIAQKARAVGIHLIVATQSPRVNVITGIIKANIPARVAFTVAQEVESRIIMDTGGAEKLLGKGDMLYKTPLRPKPRRVQSALIEIDEVEKVTNFIRAQRDVVYDDEVISQPVQIGKGGRVLDFGGGSDMDDPLYKEAVRIAVEGRRISTSQLQRRLRVGYGKAARFIDIMEEQGIVSPADGNRPREVLVSSLDEAFGDTSSRDGLAMDTVLDENFPEETA